MENTQLLRFNAKWRDPKCEDVDCLHMPDAAWQREANYCTPLGRSTLPLRKAAPLGRQLSVKCK
jgi:hypothetical protein